MRLIDADKLMKEVLSQEMWNVPDFVYNSMQTAPTVKAIPIEWIREQLKNCDNIHAELYIGALLKQWEKENE